MKERFHSPIPIPEVSSSEIVYHGYFDVRLDHLVKHQHGTRMSYTCVDLKVHAVAVLAKTKEGKFVINKEYRHPTGKWLLSCPGGRIDSGESPLEAGQRELLEETGYGGGKCTLLGNAYMAPALSDQVIYYIYVEDAEFLKPPEHEPFETIHTELKTKEELLHEIKEGFPVDGILCTALFFSKLL